jgi:hypothetical protein
LYHWSFENGSDQPEPGKGMVRSRATGNVTYVRGVRGTGLHLARSLDRYDKTPRGDLHVESPKFIRLDRGSFSFWVKLDGDLETTGGWGFQFIRSKAKSDTLDLGFNPNGGRGGYWYAGFDNEGQPQCKIFNADSNVNAVTWLNIAFTWKADDRIKLYLNGKLLGQYASMPFTKMLGTSEGKWILSPGRGRGSGLTFDEISFFENDLTPEEVWSNYRKHVPFELKKRLADKEKVIGQTKMVAIQVRSFKTEKALAQILDPSGKVVWEQAENLNSGDNPVTFDFNGITPAGSGRYYVVLKTTRPDSNYSFGFNVVFPKAPSLRTPTLSPAPRRLIARIDCTKDYDSTRYYQNAPTRLVSIAAGDYREMVSRQEGNYKHGEGFFSYRFDIQNPCRPHMLKIVYPDDKKRAVAFNVSTGKVQPPQGVGVLTGVSDVLSGGMRTREFIFWPMTQTCALTIHHWARSIPGAISAFEVYEVSDLPPLKISLPEDAPARTMGIRVEDADATRFWGGFGDGLGNGIPLLQFYLGYEILRS